MQKAETLISFDKVFFEYGPAKPILDEVGFSLRRGSKTTIMGQNGAGKSTLFSLLTKVLVPTSGQINVVGGLAVAISLQVISSAELSLTVREFFQQCFLKTIYDIDPKIDIALEAVNLSAPKDRIIKSFSGGQQARLLLASALIQDPDLLLLD